MVMMMVMRVVVLVKEEEKRKEEAEENNVIQSIWEPSLTLFTLGRRDGMCLDAGKTWTLCLNHRWFHCKEKTPPKTSLRREASYRATGPSQSHLKRGYSV